MQPNKTVIRLSLVDMIVYNLKYVYHRYLVSHALFTLPYGLLAYTTLAQGTFLTSPVMIEIIAYASIISWFFWGYLKTRQPWFVALSGVLFTLSQWAYFAGNYELDIALTLTVFGVLALKQCLAYKQFAVRAFIRERG